MKANERMNATNDLCRKWLGNQGWNNFKLFVHIIGKKDYILEEAVFDGFAFKGKEIWFLQFKTNVGLSKKSDIISKYLKIEKKYNCKCAWLSWGTKKKELTLWSTTHPKGIIINKKEVK